MKYLKWLAVVVLGMLAAISLTAGAAPLVHLSGAHMPIIGFAGMLVNKQTIQNVFISLKTTFENAFDAAPSNWDKIAMKVPSGAGQNDYAWLSRFPRMRKWVGDKVVKALAAFKYSVVNDDFEATVEVNRNDIEDDQLGIYAPQAQMAGYSAKQLPDELIFALVNNGFTSPCYDGQYFFDIDHPVGDGNGNVISVSNKGTAKLSNASLAAAKGSYGAARTALMSMKDDEGRPLGVMPDTLLVPPALEADALLLTNADKLNDNSPNPYKGSAKVVVDARLTSPTAWFLLDTSKPVRPFIYQERKAPIFVQQTDMNADDVFMRKMFKFGAEARAAAGYGFWQTAYGSDGTV